MISWRCWWPDDCIERQDEAFLVGQILDAVVVHHSADGRELIEDGVQ